MDLTREYALATLSSPEIFSADVARVLEGIVTTLRPNSRGKTIHPLGARYALPVPLLLSHDWLRPLGLVTRLEATVAGLEFVARVANRGVPMIDELWAGIKSGELSGVSPAVQTCNGDFVADYLLEEISICAAGRCANPEALVELAKESAYPGCLYVGRDRPETIFRDMRRQSRARLIKRRAGTVSLY